jgi:hypothetical protein
MTVILMFIGFGGLRKLRKLNILYRRRLSLQRLGSRLLGPPLSRLLLLGLRCLQFLRRRRRSRRRRRE